MLVSKMRTVLVSANSLSTKLVVYRLADRRVQGKYHHQDRDYDR